MNKFLTKEEVDELMRMTVNISHPIGKFNVGQLIQTIYQYREEIYELEKDLMYQEEATLKWAKRAKNAEQELKIIKRIIY